MVVTLRLQTTHHFKQSLTVIPMLSFPCSTTLNGKCLISSWTYGSENFLPSSVLNPQTVFLKFITCWFLAETPMQRCFGPNATIVLSDTQRDNSLLMIMQISKWTTKYRVYLTQKALPVQIQKGLSHANYTNSSCKK